jgi:hypothetical protein
MCGQERREVCFGQAVTQVSREHGLDVNGS